MHVALVQSPRDNEHHIVNHVAICAVVQELRQGLICLLTQPFPLYIWAFDRMKLLLHACTHAFATFTPILLYLPQFRCSKEGVEKGRKVWRLHWLRACI